MSTGISRRVKISQIVKNQLPDFLFDTVTTTNELITNAARFSATYTRENDRVVITSANHELPQNTRLAVEFVTGSGTSGYYSVREVLNANQFTIQDIVAGTTSGTVNYSVSRGILNEELVSIRSQPNSHDRFAAFLRQYYISQEFQGGPVDLIDGLNEYLKLDNLIPEVIVNQTTLTSDVGLIDPTIFVSNTKGFPDSYGLLRIGDEIITYLSKTENSFENCTRGFSGIVAYHDDLSKSELNFSTSDASIHTNGDKVENLSVLFLNEFFKSIKYSLVPGLENTEFTPELNVGNFLKEARGLYETKGTEESFKILFRVLYGEECQIIDLEQFLIKPSSATYLRREVAVATVVAGNPILLKGKSIFRSDDENISASVSEVLPITRNGITYYRLYLFVGYDVNRTTIVGDFNVTKSTKCAKTITLNQNSSEVIDVDSTIGFSSSGSFTVGLNKVLYSDKTINQFINCRTESGQLTINSTDDVLGSNTYFGFGDVERNQKVVLCLTGVLNKFNPKDNRNYIENEELYVRNLGEVVVNPTIRPPTHTEIFFNSWIYNTNCRFEVSTSTITGNQFNLKSSIDKSSLKVGDFIEILERTTEIVVPGLENTKITSISGQTVSTNAPIEPLILDAENPNDPGVTVIREQYDIRRLPLKAKVDPASKVSISYGDNKILSNITNSYIDISNNEAYVASNSLPEYEIDANIYTYEIADLDDFGFETETYGRLVSPEPVSYLEGNRVSYRTTGESIVGLSTDIVYYVGDISTDKLSFRLYTSSILIGTNNYVRLGSNSETLPSGYHYVYFINQGDAEVVVPKTLKKFNLNPNLADDSFIETPVGSVGMLINGVEIQGYKTNDKIFYGPINSVSVLNGGIGYDVVNPPILEFSSGNAKIQPVIKGSFENVLVEGSEFSVSDQVKITVSGGNGSGVVLEPVVKENQKEYLFDARPIGSGGGLDFNTETISFILPHTLFTGQEVIYDSNGSSPVGVGTYFGSNSISGSTLVTNNRYFVEVVNGQTIKLYENLEDVSSGINTVGFTTEGNSGIHKFKVVARTLSEVKVLDGGAGYTNRKLRVSSSGISTVFNYITFENHGFSDGEFVTYSCENIGVTTCSPISGVSTDNYYQIIKVDEDRFRIANSGVGGTNTSNYQRKKYEIFKDFGEGYQVFEYPPIKIDISYSSVGIGTDIVLTDIVATPIIRGSIEQIYVYEKGDSYGSTILNSKKKPNINIRNGKSAQFTPVIIGGTITQVLVTFGGLDYFSIPDIVAVSSSGSGAILKPVLTSDNKIGSVIVISGGRGYSSQNTSIIAVSAGLNAKFDVNIRPLTINNLYKFGSFEQSTGPTDFYRLQASEIINRFNDTEDLQYSVAGYSEKIASTFNDLGAEHSPIIGWADDGLPIYGPFGYSDPESINSPIRRMEPGYVEVEVENRPVGFDNEFFVEDFVFNDSGDLDRFNGRYCKTPEYPNGTYAYFATIKDDLFQATTVGKFPYFVGEYYRAVTDTSSFINQDFDFTTKDILRNTFPYKVSDIFAGNDFIVESNELISQKSVITSVNTGKISGFKVLDDGDNYKINDSILFDENDIGVLGRVSEIKGKSIYNLALTDNVYYNSVLQWSKNSVDIFTNEYFDIEDKETVVIFDTNEELFKLNGEHVVKVDSFTGSLVNILPQQSVTGIVTTVQLNFLPDKLKSGSFIKIESELCEILNVYQQLNAIKIRRELLGPQHQENVNVEFLSSVITIPKQVDFFESINNSVTYFNPVESVGVGTQSGITTSLSFYINGTLYGESARTQSILIPDHPFVQGQKVILTKEPSDSALVARNGEGGVPFNIPASGNVDTLYVINQSKNYIGLVTSVGLTTSSNGVFFSSAGSNSALYKLESDYDQQLCTIQQLKADITTTEPHELQDGDVITLEALAKNTGIGYSSVVVKYNSLNNSLLLNEKNISAGINSITNTITLENHEYETGQKLFYDSSDVLIQGLTTGIYYVVKNNEDTFKLAETFIDAVSQVPTVVSLGSTIGSGHIVSEINPKVIAYRNRDIVFDLSDSSLSGFEFNIYYDNNFNKEFINDNFDNTFSIIKSGSEGTVGAALTITYSTKLPQELFYNVKSGGFISTADTTDVDFCKIEYINSQFNGSYPVYNAFGIGSTTFNFNLNRSPELNEYNSSNTDVLRYSTTSRTAKGPINKTSIVSNINTYKEVPTFFDILTESGTGANILAESSDIGSVNNVEVSINGFAYPSDPTLRPTASIPFNVLINNSQVISEVEVVNTGNNYLTSPDLIVINTKTFEVYENVILTPVLSGSTITNVDVVVSPNGLPSSNIQVKSINNTNGIAISQVQSSLSGIVTCILQTPLSGFSTDPFSSGDQVYIEGITKFTEGDGFNSSDHEYTFFEITNYYTGSNPGRFEYDISDFTSNPGIADTIQNSFASVIKSENYPEFNVILTPSVFFLGENLAVIRNGSTLDTDLIVKEYSASILKIFGIFNLEVGDQIIGKASSSIATIDSIDILSGVYSIAAYSPQRIGWLDNVGHLNDFTQVIPDNDYYQNLSYSVKSSQEWEKIVSPVNSLLHTSGLKNFADTQIITVVSVATNIGILTASDSSLSIINTYVGEERVDVINNFDTGRDVT